MRDSDIHRFDDKETEVGYGFTRRVLTVVVISAVAVILLAVLWLGANIFLLAFGGILFAIFLRALSDPIAERTPLSEGWALLVVILLLLGVFGGGGWLIAPQLSEQFSTLVDELPEMVGDVEAYLQQYGWGQYLLDAMGDEEGNSELLAWSAGVVGGVLEALFYFLILIFIGLFLATSPSLYTRGLVKLVPPRRRGDSRELLDTLGTTLRWWLIGRALAMLMVGFSTTILLLILDIRFAVLIGVVVGFLTFIPYIGPLLGAVPIAFVSILEGPMEAVYAVGLYTVIQHIEGYILDPLIQQWAVHLPPGLTVFLQVLMGVLFGTLGIAFATPLAAVGLVTVNRLYVEKTLEG